MKKTLPFLCVLPALLLNGCAAVIVGGATAGGAIAHDRRPVSTFFEDKEALGVATGLRDEDQALKASSNIDITVYNLQVLLTGQTRRAELVDGLARRIAQLPRVRKVFNEVVVADPDDLQQAATDAYLTTRVGAALLGIRLEGFDATRVKVTTTRSTVYLMGLLTRAEADAVTEQARRVRGVRKVVRMFEYIEG